MSTQLAQIRRRRMQNKAKISDNEVNLVLHPPVIMDPGPRPHESKHNDVTKALGNVTNTGTATPLTLIAQATGDNDRIGDTVEIEAITLRYRCNANATSINNVVRLILLQWNLGSALVSPAAVSILTNSGTAADYPTQPYNYTNSLANSLSVLGDWTFCLSTAGTGSLFITKEIRRKMRLVFDAGAITGTGHLYLFEISDTAANHPQSNYSVRVIYRDS